jgi:hypothetical protein
MLIKINKIIRSSLMLFVESLILISCSSGAINASGTSNQQSDLSQYKNLLAYSSQNNSRLISSTQNNQQSFSINTTVTLLNVGVKFFSSNTCSNNSLVTEINMSGGEQGVAFPAGTYTSTGASNLALCNRYPAADSPNGCTQLYTLFESNAIQSLQFEYTYSGSNVVAAGCMSGSANSSFKETILNWAANNGTSPWGACNESANCGFSQSYNVNLPDTYATPIININPLTTVESTMMGNAFQFTATISGTGSSTVTAAFINPAIGIITSATDPCSLSVGGVENCNFTAIIYWNPLLSNNYNAESQILINATNGGFLIGTLFSYVAISPAVYLAATESGPSSDNNIGITYDSDGRVNPRFTTYGSTETESNCVLDNMTGLMWAKNLAGFGTNPPNYNSTTFTKINYAAAKALIESMNSSSNPLCGYRDWSLPTINQLTSIINYGYSSALGNWLNSSGFINAPTTAAQIWSTTLYNNGNVVILNMATSLVNNQNGSTAGVWPVRLAIDKIPNPIVKIAKPGATSTESGVTWPNPRFVIESSGIESNCLVDNLTGLMWVRNGVLLDQNTWAGAIGSVNAMNTTASAASYNLCGYSDWRLPNINELRSLLSYVNQTTTLAEWLNSNGFINIREEGYLYWSGTTVAATPANAWPVNMSNGISTASQAKTTSTVYVLPVRGGK